MKATGTGRRALIALALLAGLGSAAGAATVSLGASASWFMPSSKDFRDAYGGALVPGVSLSFRLVGGLSLWAGGDFFSKNGALTYTGEETKFRMTTLYGGLRLEAVRSAVRPYLAGALGLVSYREKSVIGEVSGSELGFLGQLGILLRVSPNFFLDFFGRYQECRAKPDVEEAAESKIGGLQAGAGISVMF